MAKKNFESALARLEEITRELEEGEISLESSLKKFDEGMKLVRFCSQKLEESQQQIDILLHGKGDPLPFAPDTDPPEDEIT